MKRENEALERYKSLHENRVRLAQEEINKINEAAAARDDFRHNYHVIRDMKARKEAEHAKLMEAARNDALATVVKAIYITAMEAEAMMDENIILAENMVDKWIDENGGASKILAKNGNNTYLLSRISQIVEDAAIEAVNEIEKDENKEEEVPDEDASKAVQIAQLTAKDAEIKAQIATLKAEKKAEDEEAAEAEDTAKEEKDAEDSEAVADTDDKADGVESTEDSDGKESTEPDTDDGDDSNNNDEAEIEDMDASDEKSEEAPADAAADEADGDTTVDAPAEDDTEEKKEEESDETDDSESEDTDSEEDVDADTEVELNDEEETDPELKKDEEELTDDEVDPSEDASEDDDVKDIVGDPIDPEAEEEDEEDKNEEIFDQLEDEEDVQKAIEIIRNRVADAEETFIKNNAEDKKKIDELLNKISNNVKTVEDLGDKDPKKAQVAQESTRECKQKIDAIYNDQTTTIFEKMSRILTRNIVKNDVVRESYTTEDGQLDTDLAMESAKVMYGFLETLNTLQIEKVDEKYIANILNGMVE